MDPHQEFVRNCLQGVFSVPSPSSLAAHFAAKLSTRATDTTPEPHLEHPFEVLLH